MNKTKERRKEKRQHYQLPVSFAEDPDKTGAQGVMIDISSNWMAFICNAGENCPHPGQKLATRFSIPRSGTDGHSDMKTFTRTGRVRRVDNINSAQCRVAIQFDEPPPFWDTPPAAK